MIDFDVSLPRDDARHTLSLCPECGAVSDGWLYESSGDIYLHTRCIEHGSYSSLYFRDADLFGFVSRLADTQSVCRSLRCARGLPCQNHLKHTYNIMIEVTLRCDLRCPVCFANAGAGERFPEPTAEEIFTRLPDPSGPNRPNVVFIGGEPTLREDLPELIRGVAGRGFIPRLSTNGLRLEDQAYTRMLARSGLRWVILQFDGLDDLVYERIRGRHLLSQKRRIIANCERSGMAVQLAVMVDESRNGDQIGAIINFGFETPAIKWINFYPVSAVGRSLAEQDRGLHVADMLRLFEEQTGGRLVQEDFLSMMRLLRRLYRITGREVLRQKISTYPMVLIRAKHGFVPLPRLLHPFGSLQHCRALKSAIVHIPALLNFQQMKIPEDFLFVTMEKFHSSACIDLYEASCCHMAFMTRVGFVPFDIYNALYRDAPNW